MTKVNPDAVPEQEWTPERALEAVMADGAALASVPAALKTPGLCLKAAESGAPLNAVPESMRTAAVCAAAVERHPQDIFKVPEKLRRHLWETAAAGDGMLLERIPEQARSERVCHAAAVRAGAAVLPWIPRKALSERVLEAVASNCGSALKDVPEKLRSAAVCRAALQSDPEGAAPFVPWHAFRSLKAARDLALLAAHGGRTLRFVPEELRDATACFLAGIVDGMSLEFFPSGMDNVVCTALLQNGEALRFLPEERRTPGMCAAAVWTSGWALKFVPEKCRTPELCLAAVKKDGTALEYVPDALKTEELCFEAVANAGEALRFVPERLKTQRLCRIAVSLPGPNAAFDPPWESVPERLQTDELLDMAIRAGMAPCWIPEGKATPERVLASVSAEGTGIFHVPEADMTPGLCLAAVRQNGMALELLPDRMKTPEVCSAAVERNGGALRFVPAGSAGYALCMKAMQADQEIRKGIEDGDAEIASRIAPESLELVRQAALQLKDEEELDHMKVIAAASIARPDRLLDELPELLERHPEFRSEMLYKVVAFGRPDGVGIVPEEYMNEALLMQAVTVSMATNRVEETLAAVPERFRTDRLCLHALACGMPDSDLCTPASRKAWQDIAGEGPAADESEEEAAGPRP